MPAEDDGRASPLLAEHRRLGARLTEFAGWEMPLQYTGVIAEHNAVRTATGVFDVSHLGKLRVSGAGSGEALQHAYYRRPRARSRKGVVFAGTDGKRRGGR